MPSDYQLLSRRVADRVARVIIDNPPVNVIDRRLFRELESTVAELERDPEVAVVVLESANPEFFLAHMDVESMLEWKFEGEATRDEDLHRFHALAERLRTLPKATICKIAGRIGGGGSEIAMSCDMRFGVQAKTILNHMEVPLGILPGSSGTQRLPRLVGRGRAMETILGSGDIDAATAERWGYLNRCFDSTAEMDAAVDQLALRIAAAPIAAVAMAKEAILAAEPEWRSGLIEESYRNQQLFRTTDWNARMRRFLAAGGQTAEGERRIADLTLAASSSVQASGPRC